MKKASNVFLKNLNEDSKTEHCLVWIMNRQTEIAARTDQSFNVILTWSII